MKFIYKQMIKQLIKKYNEFYPINTKDLNDGIQLKYKECFYSLEITKEDDGLYLILSPYKQSYFKTKFNLRELRWKLDMTLFALKEDEQYQNEGFKTTETKYTANC